MRDNVRIGTCCVSPHDSFPERYRAVRRAELCRGRPWGRGASAGARGRSRRSRRRACSRRACRSWCRPSCARGRPCRLRRSRRGSTSTSGRSLEPSNRCRWAWVARARPNAIARRRRRPLRARPGRGSEPERRSWPMVWSMQKRRARRRAPAAGRKPRETGRKRGGSSVGRQVSTT